MPIPFIKKTFYNKMFFIVLETSTYPVMKLSLIMEQVACFVQVQVYNLINEVPFLAGKELNYSTYFSSGSFFAWEIPWVVCSTKNVQCKRPILFGIIYSFPGKKHFLDWMNILKPVVSLDKLFLESIVPLIIIFW